MFNTKSKVEVDVFLIFRTCHLQKLKFNFPLANGKLYLKSKQEILYNKLNYKS